MKKYFLLTIVLLAATWGFSQNPLSFGIKAGFTSSKLNSDVDETKDAVLGYQFGVFGRLSAKKMYIQPEIYFTKKGGELKADGGDTHYSITMNTVDIPLLIGYKLADAKLANLRVMAGPVASFVYDKNIDTKTGVKFPKNDLEDASWAIQAGAGIDVLMFTLDVRYEWGVKDIYKPSDQDFKNNIFLVSLGWKIY
ncbi:MAG: PorT family protein [Lentimicrobiaceae bacterium]|nr:PorT family protein [Lentimicrobiaceae bacterium]